MDNNDFAEKLLRANRLDSLESEHSNRNSVVHWPEKLKCVGSVKPDAGFTRLSSL